MAAVASALGTPSAAATLRGQAVGMVSVQCDCGVDDAEDLLAARAFATSTPVEQIAIQVVCGETSFC